MPVELDHPVRLARIRAGLSVATLATRTGTHRATIHAIEEGRTKWPSKAILSRFDGIFGLTDGSMEVDVGRWLSARGQRPPQLGLKANAVLALSPAQVRMYRSFVHWRREISPTPTSFASMLGLPRSTVSLFEKGIRSRGMPDTLSSAIVRVLGVSNDYLIALQKLEPSDD